MSASGQGKGGGGFVSSLSVPIGLFAEYKEHRKQLKQSRSASDLKIVEEPTQPYGAPPLPPRYSPAPSTDGFELELAQRKSGSWDSHSGYQVDEKGMLIEGDEALWEVDEAIDPDYKDDFSSDDGPSELAANESMETLVRDVMTFAPGSISNPNPGKKALPCPVIIPQRRPRKKQRGFLRAYAPALADCGIGQDEFLEFLKNFHKASKASPVFTVLFVASQPMINIPNHIMNPIGILINASATVGMEVQSRQRTNNFLDRMNQELFMPAGLYAMIVKYKTDDEMEQTMPAQKSLYNMISLEKVDLNTNQSIAKYGHASDGPKTVSDRLQNLRVASSVTRGAVELPEACPLVFPDLDKQVQEAPDTFKGKFKDLSKFVSGYLDRSAQRKYAATNPDSTLATPESQRPYGSKYSDPSHPMYSSGSLLAFVSGGAYTPSATQMAVKREKALCEDIVLVLEGKEPKSRSTYQYGEDYYQDLHSRTGKYREIALQGDIKLISEGAEPKVKQNERYGDEYYHELSDRTRDVREQALRQDLGLISRGLQPRTNQEAIYGYSYRDELRTMSREYREKALSMDLERMSVGHEPLEGQDSIYGSSYYDELHAKAEPFGLGVDQSLKKSQSLTRSSSKESAGWGAPGAKESKEVKKKKAGVVKRILKEDVMYLMIVNMPSEAELAEARVEMAKAEAAAKEEKEARKAAAAMAK